MPCIAVFNQKGGVGKTTTTLNLAAAIARERKTPLLIDLDPQGHLTALCGVGGVTASTSVYAFYREHRPLAELIHLPDRPWRVLAAHLELAKVDTQFGKGPDILNRLRNALLREQLLSPQHLVLIDCSPVLGVLSLSAVFAADHVLVPVSADYLAVKAALQVERTLDALSRVLKQRVTRRYVLTRFDSRRRMSQEIADTLRTHFGEELCTTRISENVALAESPAVSKDVFDYAPNSRGAKDYQALHEELTASGFLPPTEAQATAQVQALLARCLDQTASLR